MSTLNKPTTNDATSVVKGAVKLTGDLAGTADNPTVPGLTSKLSTATAASTYAPLASPTFTGTVTLPSTTPTVSTQAVTKAYVDSQIAGVSGGSSGSGSTLPAYGQTVYADNVPSGSGLTNIAANNSTDDAAALSAILTYVKNTYNGGTVIMPAGKTVKINSSITIPSHVQIVSPGAMTWNFAGMISGAAFVINDIDFAPIRGTGYMYGPGKGSSVTAFSVSGRGLRFYIDFVSGFGKGFDLCHDNTFIIEIYGGAITSCGICLFLDIAGDSTGTAISNSGERILLSGVTLANSSQISYVAGNGVDVFFRGCSLDFSADYGYCSGGYVNYDQCHVESGNSSTPNGYAFTLHANGRMSFDNCFMVLTGVQHIINPTQGPYNYNSGRVFFGKNVSCWFTDPNGNSSTVHSDQLIYSGTASNLSFYSPFTSKWGMITVTTAANDGAGQSQDFVPYISGMNSATGQVTISFSTTPTTNRPLRVSF